MKAAGLSKVSRYGNDKWDCTAVCLRASLERPLVNMMSAFDHAGCSWIVATQGNVPMSNSSLTQFYF